MSRRLTTCGKSSPLLWRCVVVLGQHSVQCLFNGWQLVSTALLAHHAHLAQAQLHSQLQAQLPDQLFIKLIPKARLLIMICRLCRLLWWQLQPLSLECQVSVWLHCTPEAQVIQLIQLKPWIPNIYIHGVLDQQGRAASAFCSA